MIFLPTRLKEKPEAAEGKKEQEEGEEDKRRMKMINKVLLA
jgi:hypothetical protein